MASGMFGTQQVEVAETEADLRIAESKGRKDKREGEDVSPRQARYYEVVGVLGEMGLAELTGKPWVSRINTFKSVADVGHDLEARATKYRSGHLLIEPPDPGRRRYVLILVFGYGTVPNPTWESPGWMYADECKKPKYFRRMRKDREKAYWVPQEDLRPIETLEELQG